MTSLNIKPVRGISEKQTKHLMIPPIISPVGRSNSGLQSETRADGGMVEMRGKPARLNVNVEQRRKTIVAQCVFHMS